MSHKKTINDFIKKAKEVHGETFDYSKSEYFGRAKKVLIICKNHGEFLQKAESHYEGKGCPACGLENKSTNHSITRNKNRNNDDVIQPTDHKLIKLFCGAYAKVDNDDYERLSKINWSLSKGYAINTKVGFMHRYIFEDIIIKEFIDHINGDRLDNRKSNLREATCQQNNHNRFQNKVNKTSRYKGVSWNTASAKWVVNICFNKKVHYLGSFENEEIAAETYNKKAVELFSEFAKTNEILKSE